MFDFMLLVALSVAAVTLCFNILLTCVLRWKPRKAKMNNSKVVVITGCDSGFGEMTAVRLSGLGYHVVAACLTSEGRDRIQTLVAKAVVCDITKLKDVENLVQVTDDLCNSKQYSLWALVNNAGIALSGPLDWISMDIYHKVMDVNFFGHVQVTKLMLPLLKRQKHSRIINLSSIAGFYCSANLSAYGASKHAMEGFMKSIREELRPWGIYVSNVNPGFMRWDLYSIYNYLALFMYVSPSYSDFFPSELRWPRTVPAPVSALTRIRPRTSDLSTSTLVRS